MEPFEDVFEEFPDEQSEEEPEEMERNVSQRNITCIICLNLPPDIVLLPCRHLQICSGCNLKLQAQSISDGNNNYSCPTCRKVVKDSI